MVDISQIADRILEGNRRALAQAITLVESTRPDHRDQADALLEKLLPHTGNARRIGISGVPGVGKSTFIESFGMHVIDQGHKLAVLAVDPSSRVSGGSILGDKTRMESLSRRQEAFIRPSPAGKSLGGVARRSREAMLVCEAAGFDVIFVETVGVGQSETAVSEMTDMFLLLLLPSGGDELQGIKKGIVELADMVLVNKADGDLLRTAKRSKADYRSALHMLRPVTADWQVPVETVSALKQEGLDIAWGHISNFFSLMHENGTLDDRREAQAAAWLWTELSDGLIDRLRLHPKLKVKLEEAEAEVRHKQQSPVAASRRLISAFLDLS
ncbi:methylmalonyl Co-A mutase-associated GTPase MeaB [Curvivirga aplysinae]|uniref:methylmalonyl Co-A mutase-associated GTPase MeaB n=1 Tax=Curvivirga aplysinae TaxID=2529852 RepID=UPI0012BB63D3|nr:methylmalonyl Co-A mutase-associated GTPase MeaB [Curvivirga aplysinae]MTI10351.1 methylmalonyl Co-A mutase-associated GTPase MeaB [Curvivirga aplysinae]